ncbi:MAG: DUF1553 domain-containing protein [Planctomycetes bacterium]|nr:DUF1553 domain-containing protein [Planctomycetota bacterium]
MIHVFSNRVERSVVSGLLVLFGLLGGRCFAAPEVTERAAGRQICYQRDVLPILARNCFACHGFDLRARQAGLRLDSRDGATATLESGHAAVVPGDPAGSGLLARVQHADPAQRMPPVETGKALTSEQLDILRAWIEQGAVYQQHWAFVVPADHPPPDEGEAYEPIDAFVRARLRNAGLVPAPRADPWTLLRRLSLDLTGLPPTLEDLDQFLLEYSDAPEPAWRRWTEKYLASPQYGEKWARWWLDQARYADSNGYSIDAPREIWKFRDYVIEAFNSDLPLDQFTREQLAGDMIPGASEQQRVATGFHRNTQINQEGGIDREQFRIDSLFDRVATTGTVWLGLSIGCAQCHDHKFDPITQREYYQFFAFLNNQDEPTMKVLGADREAVPQQKQALEAELQKLLEARADEIAAFETAVVQEGESTERGKQLAKLLAVARDKRTFAQRLSLFAAGPGASDQEFQARRNQWLACEQILNEAPSTMVLQELTRPRTTRIFVQGDFTRPAEEVSSGTPSALHRFEPGDVPPTRLQLANWIVSPENPLTARVIVNRVWQVYFGKGLVETDNDFGLQGTPPTHPELLDWMALRFQRQGWSFKQLHRSIVASETYRQSSDVDPKFRDVDPGNALLARQRRLRLDAELIRDAALAASGALTTRIGGPPVFPPIPDGVMSQGQVKREWKASTGANRFRRGLYTFLYRATPPPALNVFDAPDGYSTCTRRLRSNTPLQALTLLNDMAFFEVARQLASLIERDGLTSAFRACTARQPCAEELGVLSSLDSLSAARVLLNLDETMTRE